MPYEMLESTLVELIGVNEQVAQNQFNASVAVLDFSSARPRSGIIRSVGFFLNGAAVGISPAGELLLMDADPDTATADTNLIAAEWLTILGNVALVNADVVAAAASETGGVALYHDLFIPFHEVSAVYALFQLTSATQFNSAGADDEQLQVNVWYENRN